MSRKSIEINVHGGMPEGYVKLDSLEIVKQQNGDERYNGILKLGQGENEIVRRVEVPDIGVMWGNNQRDYENYKADPEKWEMNKRLERMEKLLQEMAAYRE